MVTPILGSNYLVTKLEFCRTERTLLLFGTDAEHFENKDLHFSFHTQEGKWFWGFFSSSFPYFGLVEVFTWLRYYKTKLAIYDFFPNFQRSHGDYIPKTTELGKIQSNVYFDSNFLLDFMNHYYTFWGNTICPLNSEKSLKKQAYFNEA